MNQAIVTLKSALQCLSRDDLDDLTIEELDRLESDLGAWANIVMVTAMTKRAVAANAAMDSPGHQNTYQPNARPSAAS